MTLRNILLNSRLKYLFKTIFNCDFILCGQCLHPISVVKIPEDFLLVCPKCKSKTNPLRAQALLEPLHLDKNRSQSGPTHSSLVFKLNENPRIWLTIFITAIVVYLTSMTCYISYDLVVHQKDAYSWALFIGSGLIGLFTILVFVNKLSYKTFVRMQPNGLEIERSQLSRSRSITVTRDNFENVSIGQEWRDDLSGQDRFYYSVFVHTKDSKSYNVHKTTDLNLASQIEAQIEEKFCIEDQPSLDFILSNKSNYVSPLCDTMPCPKCSNQVAASSIDNNKNLNCSNCLFQFPYKKERLLSQWVQHNKESIPQLDNIQTLEDKEGFVITRKAHKDISFFARYLFFGALVINFLKAGNAYLHSSLIAYNSIVTFAGPTLYLGLYVYIIVSNRKFNTLRFSKSGHDLTFESSGLIGKAIKMNFNIQDIRSVAVEEIWTTNYKEQEYIVGYSLILHMKNDITHTLATQLPKYEALRIERELETRLSLVDDPYLDRRRL